ncbi:methyl-accepting chemotaxis protein [Geothermobacter ehrlichii]|uniref:methyl-accepting chemotaxis protein n=1 Tax=Geothermobacter ehrlichii TaxID=213224 RepID=UPI0038B2A913
MTLVTLSLIGISLAVLNKQKNDAQIINIAGRQRMLSQKMTKEALTILAGLNVSSTRAALKQTRELFDTSLKTLIEGDRTLNLPATDNPEILAQLNRVNAIWKTFSPHVQTVIDSQDPVAIQSAIKTIIATNLTLLREMNKAVILYEQVSRKKVNILRTLLICGGLITLIVTFLCWLMVNRRVVRPLGRIVTMILGMETGQLDRRLNLTGNDEISQLGQALDRFAANLQDEILTAFDRLAKGDFTFSAKGLIREPLQRANHSLNRLLGQVQTAGHEIAAAADDVSRSSQALSGGATESAASLEEVNASMQEIANQTKQNADNAIAANNLSSRAREAAEKGARQMTEMVAAMSEINQAGQEISKIIKVIDEIAFQTNLLALNAAVEAARAGTAGKGFAVVAEEVRNLAGRSAKAARETAAMIEASVEKTSRGSEIADRTSLALEEIVNSISQASDLVAKIAQASTEQAQGIAEITSGLNQIDQVTQKNTANAENLANAAEELSSQAARMQQMLRRFKLKGNSGVQMSTAVTPSAPAPRVATTRASDSSSGWSRMESQAALKPDEVIVLDDAEFGRY